MFRKSVKLHFRLFVALFSVNLKEKIADPLAYFNSHFEFRKKKITDPPPLPLPARLAPLNISLSLFNFFLLYKNIIITTAVIVFSNNLIHM